MNGARWQRAGRCNRPPDGKVVYITCEGDGEVVAIDTATLKVISHMHTDLRPRSVVFTRDGSTAFATAERGAAVTVLDAIRHNVIETIKIPSAAGKTMPARPMGSVLAPDGKHIYVSDGRGESVAVIDVATRKLTRMINDVGARPWGIGVSSDGGNIYTANGPSDDVSVVDVETGRVERRIKVGGRPWVWWSPSKGDETMKGTLARIVPLAGRRLIGQVLRRDA